MVLCAANNEGLVAVGCEGVLITRGYENHPSVSSGVKGVRFQSKVLFKSLHTVRLLLMRDVCSMLRVSCICGSIFLQN